MSVYLVQKEVFQDCCQKQTERSLLFSEEGLCLDSKVCKFNSTTKILTGLMVHLPVTVPMSGGNQFRQLPRGMNPHKFRDAEFQGTDSRWKRRVTIHWKKTKGWWKGRVMVRHTSKTSQRPHASLSVPLGTCSINCCLHRACRLHTLSIARIKETTCWTLWNFYSLCSLLFPFSSLSSFSYSPPWPPSPFLAPPPNRQERLLSAMFFGSTSFLPRSARVSR